MEAMLIPTAQEIVHFSGLIDSLNVVEILNDVESKAQAGGIGNSTRKKIFNIAVEALQNLYHHTSDFTVEGKSDDEMRKVQFSFREDESYYYIITSNLLFPKHFKIIEEKLNFVNNLSVEELKELYRKVLTNNQLSNKGGAGLGFIDMRRKSGYELEYLYDPIDQELAKFTFIVKININKEKE
jgi:hypothetical protein